MAGLRKRVGEILTDMRVLKSQDVQTALEEQQTTGEKIGEIFIRRGMCKSADVLTALGAQHGLPTIDLSGAVAPHNLPSLIESGFAEKKGAALFQIEGQGISAVYHVGLSNPRDPSILQDLEFKLRGKVKLYAALDGQIHAYIRRCYYAQEYGYDLSFHEGQGFRIRTEDVEEGEAPQAPRAQVLGQPAPKPKPKPAAERHPAATSFSDLSGTSARIASLEADVARLRSILQALLKLLNDQGVITREELKAAMSGK